MDLPLKSDSMQELFASLQLTNKPEPRANFVERLPIELWIKVASHIGDLERFHPSRSGFYVPRDSPGHNTATIRALSATSNFFFNVCLPMRYYDMALCGSEWSREGYREGLTPHFTTILDDHRVTPHIRTLIWVGSAEPESVPPLALATLFNLRFLDLHPDITTAALYGVIFTLPNLTHLVLHDLPYAINLAESVDSSNLAFLRLQLDSGIEHGYPFLDSLHRFSKLRELQLLSRTAAQILDCFMSNGRPALRLDSLAIIGHTMRWQTNDYQFFYKYLMQHGSSLRTLFISHLSGRLPPDVGGALPSLRTYRGSMAFAQSCLAPCVEEILFTAYSGLPPVDPFTIIFSNNVSPSSLRRLEMPAPSFSLNAVSLDSILGHFPNLELLIFGDMKNPEGGPGAYDTLTLFPPSYLPNLNRIRTLVFSSYPRTSSHLTFTNYLSSPPPAVVKAWGRRNPNLYEFGMYRICWRRNEGGQDDDWGGEIMAHETWMPRAYLGKEF